MTITRISYFWIFADTTNEFFFLFRYKAIKYSHNVSMINCFRSFIVNAKNTQDIHNLKEDYQLVDKIKMQVNEAHRYLKPTQFLMTL